MATPADGAIEVDVDQTAQLRLAGAQIVDVREDHEVEAGHIPGITHIALGELGEKAGTLDPAQPVVFVCKSGGRSLMAAQALRGAGFDAYSLAGGTQAWQDAGQPLEPEDGHVASH
ncbi:MAG: rhodanese-like protein [Solirubrobacterales bacterium]|jgi:rhodanese-related sulfurtransferase|nr:rhodanese-like protein [Solirubrobacterales bacterium]